MQTTRKSKRVEQTRGRAPRMMRAGEKACARDRLRRAAVAHLRRSFTGGGILQAPIFALLAFVTLLAQAGFAAAQTPPSKEKAALSWTPPLAPPLRLTATFGEYRSGHIHAGIDLSTGKTTGMPVRAAADGRVVRVRAGGGGYGCALYLETSTGLLAVYGHLERFHPKIAKYVESEQRAKGEYEVDLFPERDRFVFRAGETIAWSGQSGSGPPHLHFELRNGDEPLNPLDLGVAAPDLQPPVFGTVRLRALAPDAFVNGGASALPAGGNGAQEVRVWGRVGVECWVLDRSGTTDARLAPREIDLFLDGEAVFRRGFERLDFARNIEVDRVYGTLDDGPGTWGYRLYTWPLGSAPDLCSEEGLSGRIDFASLEPGVHTLRIEARDAAGRSSAREIKVVVEPPVRIREWRAVREGEGGWLIGARLAGDASDRPDEKPAGPVLEDAALGEAARKLAAGLSLSWRAAGEQREAQAAAIGPGWISWRLPGSGKVEVRDGKGRALLPPMDVASVRTTPDPPPRVDLRFEEGFLALEVFPAVLPREPLKAFLCGEGHSVPLTLRGVGENGGWLFAAGEEALNGRTDRLRIATSARAVEAEIPMDGLFHAGPKEAGEGVASLSGAGDADASLGPGLTLRLPVDSFFGPAWLQATVEGLEESEDAARGPGDGEGAGTVSGPAAEGELRRISAEFRLDPQGFPLQAPLELRADASWLPPDAERGRVWGLCRRRGEEWSWLGRVTPDSTAGGGFTASLPSPGRYALLVDERAPRPRAISPGPGERLLVSPVRLEAAVTEEGSGFAPQDADILLDGRMLLAVWEVDERRLVARLDAPLAPGRHTWEVRIRDRAGNEGRESYSFRVAGR